MDIIHKTPRASIYFETQYLVNSDMSIPYALAHTWNYGVTVESGKRTGIVPQDRAPQFSPLVLRAPTIPKGK